MNLTSFLGRKIDQEQIFNDKGKRLVVTRLKTLPLKVKSLKTEKKDGYWAAVVEVEGKGKKKILREIKIADKPELKKGAEIKLEDVFKAGDLVKVTGITKGKGFAGVIKRWGFAGGPRTHGQSDRERAPGSIGQGTDPGRVWKGKKMPGHMGNKTKTIKGLKVFNIDEKNQELLIQGLVPGNKGGLVRITKI